jgi:hypothetical protein
MYGVAFIDPKDILARSAPIFSQADPKIPRSTHCISLASCAKVAVAPARVLALPGDTRGCHTPKFRSLQDRAAGRNVDQTFTITFSEVQSIKRL